MNRLPIYLFQFVSFCLTAQAGIHAIDLNEEEKAAENVSSHAGFLIPNEVNPNHNQEIIAGKKGTLISVGTFRTLYNALPGDFSTIVFYDLSEATFKFNQSNLELISDLESSGYSSEEQRYRYIGHLLRCELRNDFIASLLALSNPEKALTLLLDRFTQILGAETVNYLDEVPPMFPEFFFREVPFNSEEYLKVCAGARYKFAHPIRNKNPDQPVAKQWTVRLKELIEHRPEVQFWASDALWEKLQNLIRTRQFVLLNGNILGEASKNKLKQYLFENGEKVSILDISNVLDYVKTEEYPRLEALFAELPWTEDAQLITTNFLGYYSFIQYNYGRDGINAYYYQKQALEDREFLPFHRLNWEYNNNSIAKLKSLSSVKLTKRLSSLRSHGKSQILRHDDFPPDGLPERPRSFFERLLENYAVFRGY
jgi:hypothetical protein